MPQHEHDRSEFAYQPKGPVAARIEELKTTMLTAIRLTMPGHAVFPDAPIVDALGATLESFHAEFRRCAECEAIRYRQGKADAIAEEMERVKTEAGRLFADGFDEQAMTLRDRINGLGMHRIAELEQVGYLKDRSGHTCTLDGLFTERA